jgi:hypothetical protein
MAPNLVEKHLRRRFDLKPAFFLSDIGIIHPEGLNLEPTNLTFFWKPPKFPFFIQDDLLRQCIHFVSYKIIRFPK